MRRKNRWCNPCLASLSQTLFLQILRVHVLDEIDDAARVTELIIVPGNQLDEVLVQSDSGGCIEDGRVRITDEVLRHNLKMDEEYVNFLTNHDTPLPKTFP